MMKEKTIDASNQSTDQEKNDDDNHNDCSEVDTPFLVLCPAAVNHLDQVHVVS